MRIFAENYMNLVRWYHSKNVWNTFPTMHILFQGVSTDEINRAWICIWLLGKVHYQNFGNHGQTKQTLTRILNCWMKRKLLILDAKCETFIGWLSTHRNCEIFSEKNVSINQTIFCPILILFYSWRNRCIDTGSWRDLRNYKFCFPCKSWRRMVSYYA